MKLDYEHIKRELPIERVLHDYGMMQNLKRSGTSMYGCCPIHGGDNPHAFSVSLDKNLWNCFTHCRGGSVIDLLMAVEKVDFLRAVRLGYDMLGMDSPERQPPKSGLRPLQFHLSLDHGHPYLKERNVDHETAKYFDIGYCSKGIMAGRIAIPIHDGRGNLVAYCGRSINNTEPKYRFPQGFQKSKAVYNLHRVRRSHGREIVVVEGFFDVLALYRSGIESVALMGSSVSEDQKNQLLSLEQRLTLMLDGDSAGRRGMTKAIDALNECRPLKAVYLPDGMQPEYLGSRYVREILS